MAKKAYRDYKKVDGLLLTPKVLNEIGVLLFGRNWVTRMAGCLHVQRRSVQRWKSGVNKCQGPAVVALLLILDRRGALQSFPKLKVALNQILSRVTNS